MNHVLYFHSLLRYAVLLAGLFALAVHLMGLANASPYAKIHRVSGAVYSGLLQLQAVIGLTGLAMGMYYPALIGHLVLMLAAAIGLQVVLTRNRRSAAPSLKWPTIAIVASLLLILLGIAAIKRGPLTMTYSL